MLHLKAKKISLVTPYPQWNNQALKTFLDETPWKIISFQGDERPKELAKQSYLWHQSPDEAKALIKQVDHKDADAIVLPCTAWRTLEIIAELEADLHIPVVTANQATIWSLAKKVALKSALIPRGMLFNITVQS